MIAAEPEKVRGKSVLELGAGVGIWRTKGGVVNEAKLHRHAGLVGLVASLFCDQVLITDGEEEAVSMIEQNIRNNKEALPGTYA